MDCGCSKHEERVPLEHGERFSNNNNAYFAQYRLYPCNPVEMVPYPTENPDVDWTYSGADPGLFLREQQQRLSRKVWRQAAKHCHGKGAENGVDMTVLRTHHKQCAHTRLVCFTNLPQHRFTTAQEFASTIWLRLLRLLLVVCVTRVIDVP